MRRSLLLALAALLTAALVWAQDVLPVPALSGRVIDLTATLSAPQVQALQARLAAYEAESGAQVVILMLPTTAPEDIAAYSQRIGDAWKIGRRDVGDALLIVVAKDDRKVDIQTTKALEGAVPDLAARQIIDRAMAPAFREGDFAGGLDAALDQLFARISGEALPQPRERDRRSGSSWGGLDGLEGLLMFFFIAVPVVGGFLKRLLGRKLGALATAGAAGGLGWLLTASILLGAGAGVAALVLVGLFGGAGSLRGMRHGGFPIILGGGGIGGGGFGGGDFGGGGFSSGGGGDFGGGGASGDW